MADQPDPFTIALAQERAGYLRANRADRILPVDEALAERGWCVTEDGELVKVDAKTRRRTTKKAAAPERADQKAPEDTAEPGAKDRG